MLPWLQTCNSTATLTHVIHVFKSLVYAHKIQGGNGLIMRGKYQEKPEVPPCVIFNRHEVSNWGGHTFDSSTIVGLSRGTRVQGQSGLHSDTLSKGTRWKERGGEEKGMEGSEGEK